MTETGSPDLDKKLASLLDVADALLRGEFTQEGVEIPDAEGLLPQLAKKINIMIVNLRNVEMPLSSASEAAPELVNRANSVAELMSQSTDEVLNKSDRLTELADSITHMLDNPEADCTEVVIGVKEKLNSMKAATYDIIASQSYQDVARQKMEGIIKDLTQLRDWLLEALIVLNIRKDGSEENVKKKVQLLQEVKETKTPELLKQDLVDDLLAEFGF
ncbi:MAG: protein phosphatase CheZ [Proteobacteria bacterium]|nr:protein phosphatase CheZ [Pseudomonadota bacterium]MBU4296876.1 protein phosphatase CheZ [Pseudomonadota bacterium]MCG2746514.1 protein phosphatase CheZ [Desulfobulbaceae bacterium]